MSQLYIYFVEWCCKVFMHCLSSPHCLPLWCDSISYQCHVSCFKSPVLLCQMFPLPFVLQYLLQYIHESKCFYYIKFLATVYGIWSLDFFCVVIPPICLPLNTMHIIALDYLVAVYPLFLLVCVYVLLTAHDRGCRIVVWLWRPFLWCTTRLRQSWNIRHSIINAFATFLLLSYTTLLNTSCNLLIYTSIHNDLGSFVGHFLFYDTTIEFMGPQHMPFAVLAIVVLLVGILFPLLLLLLYPMQWFQKYLNKCHLNSPGLQIFMECFQGYYRDRTDGGWECRYFAAVYPALRIAAYILYSITLSNVFYMAFILLCLIVLVTILLVQPYKKPCALYNKIDAVMIITSKAGAVAAGVVAIAPLVYFTIKILLLLKHVLCQNVCLCYRVFHGLKRLQRREHEDLSVA